MHLPERERFGKLATRSGTGNICRAGWRADNKEPGEKSVRTIRKAIAVPLVALACGTSAHACTPPYHHTEYFGESTYLSDEVRDKVLDDIRANHYTVIEPQIGLLFYAIVRKGDGIYLGTDRIATGNDSFWYLGNGYYQLNGQIYFLGEHVGAYPLNGTVVVHTEDRTRQRPDDYPKGRLFCVVTRHASILETSTGLRIERIVNDS
ncbi:hypothetical protein LGN17_08550 [Burkholderia sp. AU30280]|uniref:hypothetical protein n=1 Tax=Burkholderia sp. AU30280 TaxID=2879628 RepID=UPI001CF2C42D|nr:hypothetical protein [Burkholderia sp. AU30280]MCA8272562.1 hypothetical protein [Burkholderia sp. AU30280]